MTKTRHNLARYSGSLALVLGVHAVAVLLTLNWSVPQAIELPPAAMVVELAPLPEPAPPPPPKAVPQPPAPVEELPLPKLAEAPKPTISVPTPKPKPKPQPPKPVEKKPETPKEKPSDTPPSEAQPSTAPPAKSAQPNPGPTAAQNAAKASWQGTLLAHLQKYKKYPPGAQARGKEGLNRLRFVVDAEGNVFITDLNSNEIVNYKSDVDFYFYDITAQFQQKIGSKNELNIDVIAIENTLQFNQSIDNLNKNSALEQENFGTTIQWKTTWNDKNSTEFKGYEHLEVDGCKIIAIIKDGQCIGAVGVSGVKSNEDAQVAKAGIAAIGL